MVGSAAPSPPAPPPRLPQGLDLTPPRWLFMVPLAVGVRKGASRHKTLGFRGWASEFVLRPWGAAPGVASAKPTTVCLEAWALGLATWGTVGAVVGCK